ncbi:MAG: glycosyltransferase family 2 protein [Candidatus Helarchaeota archaeon]
MEPKKVSILILTWNKLEYTRKCLEYLEKNTKYPDWEVIFIDNGSKDGTQKFLKEIRSSDTKKYRIILNNSNVGYARGVNQGIKIANGEYILLLNNDVYVFKNWLTSMVNIIEKNNSNAIIGAKLIYPETKRIQHAGIIFLRKIEPLHIYKNSSLRNPEVNKIRYVDAVTGACMLIRRKIFDEIGFFDEKFKFGGYEDTDFCLRTRVRGYNIIYSPKSVAYHDERITSSQISNYYAIFNYNRNFFLKKWTKVLAKYNDSSLKTSFKLKMYLIYGIFKIVPKRLEFTIKKWLTKFLSVQ